MRLPGTIINLKRGLAKPVRLSALNIPPAPRWRARQWVTCEAANVSYAGDCAGGQGRPEEGAANIKSSRLRTQVINHKKERERERALCKGLCKVLLLPASLPHPDLSFTLPTQLSCETSNLPRLSLPGGRIVEHFSQGPGTLAGAVFFTGTWRTEENSHIKKFSVARL